MNRFEATRISVWLQEVVTTEEQEIDCDELSNAIHTVAEAAARGEDVRGALPVIAVHLDHCPDCQEWFETLVELSQDHQVRGS